MTTPPILVAHTPVGHGDPAAGPFRGGGPHRLAWLLLLCLGACASSPAGVPPAEHLLPTNTIAAITLPDAPTARAEWARQGAAQAWALPAMAPFRNSFEGRLRTNLVAPLARLTGLDLARLADLAEGQVTIALLHEEGTVTTSPVPAQLLILDTGSKSAALQDWLAHGRGAATRPPRTTLVLRGTEFDQLTVPAADLRRVLDDVFPPTPRPTRSKVPAEPPQPVLFGSRGSLLLAGTSTNALAALLRRIEEEEGSRPGRAPLAPPASPDTVLRGWLAVPPLLDSISSIPLPLPSLAAVDPALSTARLANALGFGQLQRASFAVRASRDGWRFDLGLDLAPGPRRGLFRWLEVKTDDAGPPPFLGTNVVQFTRVRLPGPGAWAALERMLRDIDPALQGVLQLFTGYAGKAEDADFDFQKNFIDLLGDDWIAAEARVTADGPPADLVVVGSPRAADLAKGLRLIVSPEFLAAFFPPDGPEPQRTERLVAGLPMSAIRLPPIPGRSEQAVTWHFGSRGGHLAWSGAPALVEAFLSGEPPSPLAARPDFLAAAAGAGGTGGGYFSFADERDTARRLFQALRTSPEALRARLRWATITEGTSRLVNGITAAADFTQLPAFEEMAPWFGPRATAGRVTANGFELTTFRPAPVRP